MVKQSPLLGIHSKDCHELKTKAHTGAFMCLPEVVCSLSHREDYPDTHPSSSLNTATCYPFIADFYLQVFMAEVAFVAGAAGFT